jgi:hypothetical protein
MKQQESKLKNILNVGFKISQIKDIDLLLEKILGETRAFTNVTPVRSMSRKAGACVSAMPRTTPCNDSCCPASRPKTVAPGANRAKRSLSSAG